MAILCHVWYDLNFFAKFGVDLIIMLQAVKQSGLTFWPVLYNTSLIVK